MDTAKTGAYLASLRKNAGMTQQEVADRLGVSNKTVSKWESGGGFPDITVLPALAELYGVTADDILAPPNSIYHITRFELSFTGSL